MAQQIILRKGSATAWTLANPTLAAGEPGVETDTGKFKLGNGVTAWISLAYAVGTIPTDVGQLADVGDLIPTNLADLADVASAAPSIGQVLKWDGTQWLPSADATGGGGAGATTLDELTDVVITGTPTNGQVLKYSGTTWTAGTETSQTLSSATSGSGVNVNLSGGGGTVKFETGSNNVTVTRVGETIEIDSDNTTYTLNASNDGNGYGSFAITNSDTIPVVQRISFTDSPTATVRSLGSQSLLIDARNTTYSSAVATSDNGATYQTTGKIEASAVQATLTATGTTVTVTAGSVFGLYPGLSLVKTSGIGAFGTDATIVTIDTVANSFTVDVPHSVSGAVTFNVRYLRRLSLQIDPTSQLSITASNDKTVVFSTTSKITSGIVNRLAFYADGANLTTVSATNDGLAFDPTTKWTTMTSGRLALNNHDLVFTRQNIGTGVRNEGLLYQVFYDQAATTAWNWTRGRGAQQTPTPAQIGDDLFRWRFYGQWGTTTTDLAMAASIFGTITNNVTTNRVGATITFSTSNGTSAAAARVKITADGYLQADTLQALTTNGDLNIITNGTGYIRLPLNTTVGGVPVGSVVLKGTLTGAALTALTGMVTGDAYVCSSTSGIFIAQHIHLYSGSAWNDLGSFQGPAGIDGADGLDGVDGTNGTNGQGVPTGGTAGQVLSKINSTNYNTQWSTITLPTDISDLTDTTSVIPTDISDLTDTTSVIPTTLTDLGIVDGTVGQVLTTNGAGAFTFSTVTSGSGDVVGPATATDNALARYDSTTGKLVQDSLVTVSDTGAITAPSVGSIIPFYFANQAAFPSAVTHHGAIAHSHSDGKMYFAHGGVWNALANASELGGGTASDSFKTITVAGQDNVVADNATDTLTLVAGTNVTITTNATNDSITINAAGGGASALDDLSDVVITGTPTNGQVLKYDSGTSKWINGTDATGGGGSLPTRATLSGATGNLADGAVGSINITGYKSYMLLKVQTSAAAWVRIYVSEAARIADASRLEGTDPTPGTGIIAEVITTGAQTVLISPGVMGFNNENPVTTNIPIRVTNKSGGTADITVTLTALQLEA